MLRRTRKLVWSVGLPEPLRLRFRHWCILSIGAETEKLMEEAMALNYDFLDQSEEQFEQYLSLTVI